MSVILTGFSSSIGKALLKDFLDKGTNVFCLGRRDISNVDYTNYGSLKRFFLLDFKSTSFESELEDIYSNLKEEKINTIIHAAADPGKRNYIKTLVINKFQI